jgi:hypothetical protein
MPAQRNHNEWFRPVSCGGRKSCPGCHAKLGKNESIWSWGNYVRAKWNTVTHFCKECFETRVAEGLLEHAGECGCTITLVMYHAVQPKWLRLKKRRKVCTIAPVIQTPPTLFEAAMAMQA